MNGLQNQGMPGSSNGATLQSQQPGAISMQGIAALAGPGAGAGGSDQQRLSQLMTLSFMPLDELRRRNVPTNIIEMIESNRAMLQRTAHQQRESFRDSVRNGQNMAGKVPMFNGNVNRPQLVNGGAQVPQHQAGPSSNGQPGMPIPRQQPILRTHRPSPEEATKANEMIGQLRGALLARFQRSEYSFKPVMNHSLTRKLVVALEGPFVSVPEHQRAEYNSILEQLNRFAASVEQKLSWCACYLQEVALKRMMEVVSELRIFVY